MSSALPKFIGRTIIRSESFRQQLAQIEPDLLRADEIMMGVEWYLSRHTKHEKVVVKTSLFGHGPRLTIIADVQEVQAELISVDVD